MNIHIPVSPEQSPDRDRNSSILILYRENELFRGLIPRIQTSLIHLGIPVRVLSFPAGTTPSGMEIALSESAKSLGPSTLVVTDVSARRGIRALESSGVELLAAAHSGVLLDRSLASTVKRLIATELRAPLLSIMTSTPSPAEMAAQGEITLRAERVFFEALLAPLALAYPQHQFIIAAPMLMHHLPFVSYIGALQATYIGKMGGADETIPEKLLAWDAQGTILHQPRIPSAVKQKLSFVATEAVSDPCDWIAGIVGSFGFPPAQITIAESARALAQMVKAEDRHLTVVLGDRHLLSEDALTSELIKEGMSSYEASYSSARCLAGATFRFPLESLVADIADAGLLGHLRLLHSSQVQDELADAISREIRNSIQKRRIG